MDNIFSVLTYISWSVDAEVIPGFTYLRWYSVCWAIGVYVAFTWTARIFKKEDVDLSLLDKLALYVMIGVVVGARLGHILFYDPVYYWNNPVEILPIKIHPHFEFTGFLGLASHGGVLGALLALYIFNRKFKIGFLWALDRLVMAGALLGAFIRVGNLFNSEIIGIPTSVPWAFIFTRIDNIPRHPAQLYEAISYLVIFLILYLIWKSGRVKERSGFLIGLGLLMIFSMRFLLELVKENQVAFENEMTFNMGQWLSLPIVASALVLLLMSLRSQKASTKF